MPNFEPSWHVDDRPLAFHPEAEAEALAAVDWYAQRNPAIAARFREELEAAMRWITIGPQLWPMITRILSASVSTVGLVRIGQQFRYVQLPRQTSNARYRLFGGTKSVPNRQETESNTMYDEIQLVSPQVAAFMKDLEYATAMTSWNLPFCCLTPPQPAHATANADGGAFEIPVTTWRKPLLVFFLRRLEIRRPVLGGSKDREESAG